MNLETCRKLALNLMQQYGLVKQGWCFEFDKATRRFGCCNYTEQKISMSKTLVLLNDEDRVKLTILHEIAHALCPSQGHNEVWRRKCLEIGGDGKRCYTSANTVCTRYKYECPGCKAELNSRHKLRGGTRSTTACKPCCVKHNNGRFDARFQFVLAEDRLAEKKEVAIVKSPKRAAIELSRNMREMLDFCKKHDAILILAAGRKALQGRDGKTKAIRPGPAQQLIAAGYFKQTAKNIYKLA